MKLRTHFCSFAVIGIALLSAPHCQDFFERDTKIEMDGMNPPTFTLSGNGQVGSIEVIDKSVSEVSDSAPERTIWQIESTGETTPDRFPKITYGVVPPGFVQRVPVTGSPRTLVDEKPYLVSARTSNANTGTLMFLIRNSQALRVDRGNDQNYYVQTPTPK